MISKIEEISSGLDKNIFDFLFGYKNIYCIFREEVMIFKSSHKTNKPYDALVDILISNYLGEIRLKTQDIICIRIKGNNYFYSFLGCTLNSIDALNVALYFIPYQGKLIDKINEKRNMYIRNSHIKEKVIDILSCKNYDIRNIDLNSQNVFAIEKEDINVLQCNKNFILSYYTVLQIVPTKSSYKIKNILSNNQRFSDYEKAIEYFYYSLYDEGNTLLLINRSELEMIIDIYDLERIIV